MIRIPLELAVAIYLTISLAILVLWVVLEGRGKMAGSFSEKDALRQCPLCFYFYIDSHSEEISQCPQCEALHKKF